MSRGPLRAEGMSDIALSPLEIHGGWVFGRLRAFPPLPLARPQVTARDVLEELVVDALAHPPCVVSFSGGRDSSAVLAVAAYVARREGLPPPIPVTLRFPADDQSDESDWQEFVIRHLRLGEWQRRYFTDELDVVGPYAQRVLLRHGVVWPANVHFHLPILEAARGGTVLTGAGGDELLGPRRWRPVARVLARVRKPAPSDFVRIAVAYAPWPLRWAWFFATRSQAWATPWLKPAAAAAFRARYAAELAAERVWFDDMVATSWWPTRYRVLMIDTFARLGADVDVTVCHPLGDGAFLAQTVHDLGRLGPTNRTDAMARLVADLLPDELLGRRSKAGFTRSFFNRHSAGFVAGWDGSGLDERLVRPEVLRRLWTDDPLRWSVTFPALQQAWLSTRRDSTPQSP